MKKWYDEEYEWEIEVTGFLRSDHTERYCRNGDHGVVAEAKRSGNRCGLDKDYSGIRSC